MHLTRDQFLNADDLATEEVDLSDLPGYNGSVLVRGMTGAERDAWEVSMLERGHGGRLVPNRSNVRAKLVAQCCVGDDGERLFTIADVQAIGRKNAAAVDRLFGVASRLSGLSEEDKDELVQDFPPGQDGAGSPTPSPATSATPSANSSHAPTPGNSQPGPLSIR